LEVDYVGSLDSVLGQDVQLMVNIAPTTVHDKNLVHEYTEICLSLWTAIDAVSTMASSEFPNVSFAKYVR
jgi:hypothetical protein